MTVNMARSRVRELEQVCATRFTVAAMAELASCYFTLGDPERALPLAKQAFEFDRKNSGYGMNLAMMLKDAGRHEESFRVLETSYWNNGDDFYIQLGYAEAMLKQGLWKQAWPIYDNARPTQQGAAHDLAIPHSVREWDGGEIGPKGKLLVINEGGTGDRISYARWLPELTKRGINWRFFPYPELFPLFERIFPRELLVAENDSDEEFTHWTTTFSLMAKLKVGPTEIPPPLQLKPLPEKVEQFKINRTSNLPVIGLCYRAAEMYQGGRTVRSLNSAQAMRLRCMTADKIVWVSLQQGEKLDYPAVNCELSSWEDTLGLMENLDGIVTVDTSILHMAGCLNKPIALLLSGNACWKYLRKGERTGWYPSAKVYRNTGFGFEEAIDNLVADIRSNTVFRPLSEQDSMQIRNTK